MGLMRGAAARALSRAVHALLLLPLTGCAAATIDRTAVDDAQIAVRIKTALVNDPMIGTFTIEVRVVRGVAALSGRVRTEADIARVIDLARRVDGVTDVRPNLQTGAVQAPALPAVPEGRAPPPADSPQADSPPGLIAVGASVGWSVPASASFSNRISLGPLIKLGSPTGFGPAIGFDWYRTELTTDGTAEVRVRVKPIMGGVGYTWRLDRLSVSSSIVGGYAFNSLTIRGTGNATTVPIGVGNSFAWRVGASVWYDVSRRVAMNISGGRVTTGLRVTVLQDERLDRRDTTGNATILHAGLAYRLF
jgi:hypothetical protein